MMREETIGDCRLILADCREVLPTLGRVDAVVTDLAAGAAGERYPALSGKYGVSVSTISLIKLGRIWRHVQ